MTKWPFKSSCLNFKIQAKSALGPLRKVLELLKSSNFAFGGFSNTLEKFGEKQTWTSVQYKNNWISEFFQSPQLFSRPYFKICSVLDKTPIRKVVDPFLLYKVSFNQKWSTVQNLRDKWFGISATHKTITETFWTKQNFNFRSV